MNRPLLLFVVLALSTSSTLARPVTLSTNLKDVHELRARYVFQSALEAYQQGAKARLTKRQKPGMRQTDLHQELLGKMKVSRKGSAIFISIDEYEIEFRAANIFQNRYTINGLPWTYDPSAPEALQLEMISQRVMQSLAKQKNSSVWLSLLLPRAHAIAPLLGLIGGAAARVLLPVAKAGVVAARSPLVQTPVVTAVSTVAGMGLALPWVNCIVHGMGCNDLKDEEMKVELAKAGTAEELNETIQFTQCANEGQPLVFTFLIDLDGVPYQIRRTLKFKNTAEEGISVPDTMADEILTHRSPRNQSVLSTPIRYTFEEGLLRQIRPTRDIRDLIVIPDAPKGDANATAESNTQKDAVMDFLANGYKSVDVSLAVQAQKMCKLLEEIQAGNNGVANDPAVNDEVRAFQKNAVQ